MLNKMTIRKLTYIQRALLMRHLDGCEVPIIRYSCERGQSATRTLNKLHALALIRSSPQGAANPTHTIATLAGREAIAVILGDCADALVAAGFLERSRDAESPLEALRRLKMAKMAENAPAKPGNGLKSHHFPLDL